MTVRPLTVGELFARLREDLGTLADTRLDKARCQQAYDVLRRLFTEFLGSDFEPTASFSVPATREPELMTGRGFVRRLEAKIGEDIDLADRALVFGREDARHILGQAREILCAACGVEYRQFERRLRSCKPEGKSR